MDCLKNIVVGVDFSSFSRFALKQAARIALWNEAKLHVLHVVDTSVVTRMREFWNAKPDSLEPKVSYDKIRDSAATMLEELVGAPKDVSVHADVVPGTPFVELLRCVQAVSADLLVLGSNGSSDPSKGAGTLATKCVRKAATKVLLVRGHHEDQFKNIVACVDFSESSHRVVEQAIRVAQQDAASLRVLHVFSPIWEGASSIAQSSPGDQQHYTDSLSERLQVTLEPYKSETHALQVETNVVENARESDGIVEFAESVEADLVVVGTRGRSGMKAILLGTVAERIVRESPCSVLAVKPDDFEYVID